MFKTSGKSSSDNEESSNVFGKNGFLSQVKNDISNKQNQESKYTMDQIRNELFFNPSEILNLSSEEDNNLKSESGFHINTLNLKNSNFSEKKYGSSEELNLNKRDMNNKLEIDSSNNLETNLPLVQIQKRKELCKILEKTTASENCITDSSDDRKYKCCLCGNQFKLKHHLDQHILTHTSYRAKCPRPHSCEICCKKFKLKHHLERHLITHSRLKTFKCATCDKSYVDKHDLQKHLKKHWGVSENSLNKKFSCDVCPKIFNTDSSLQKHIQCHNLSCAICGKKFLRSKNLNNHLKVHANLTSFSCEVCGKSFPFEATLTEHFRSHTGEKPFECEVCNKKFSTKSNQDRHFVTHFKVHKCKYCTEEFLEKDDFKQHLKICKKCNKNFKCEECDRNFTKLSNLKRHLQIHSRNKNSA